MARTRPGTKATVITNRSIPSIRNIAIKGRNDNSIDEQRVDSAMVTSDQAHVHKQHAHRTRAIIIVIRDATLICWETSVVETAIRFGQTGRNTVSK